MQEVSQQLKACKNSIDQKKTSAEELVSCAEESEYLFASQEFKYQMNFALILNP